MTTTRRSFQPRPRRGTAGGVVAVLFATALMFIASGCYTTISTVSMRGSGGYAEPETANEQADRGNAAAVENDTAEGEEDVSSEFALKPTPYGYTESETYTDADGKTTINNYYNFDYPSRWYGPSMYPRMGWYDPYGWDRPGFSIGIGYGYDPWWDGRSRWSWGMDWYWTDPYWGWYDPWYAYSWYPYHRSWYAGGWYGGGWENHGGWNDHHGGGGGGGNDGNGGDLPNNEFKYRTDRLAGFGTSRSAGGTVSVGGGGEKGSTDANVTGKQTNTEKPERSVRRDPREGMGTSGSRRRDAGSVSTGAEKPASGTEAGKTETPQKRRDNGNSRRKMIEDQMIQRYRAFGIDISKAGQEGGTIQVRRRPDGQNQSNGRTETGTGGENAQAGGEAAVGKQPADQAPARRLSPSTMVRRIEQIVIGKSNQSENTSSAEKPSAKTERSAETQKTERSQPSKPSYTAPTSRDSGSQSSGRSGGSSASSGRSGGSGSSGSGGGSSRPSDSRSGSRRR